MNFQNGFHGSPGLGGGFGAGFGGGHGGGNGGGGGYGGGYGGGRGRGRRDERGGRGGRGRGGPGHNDGGRQQPPESSNARLRKMVVKFADEEDFHPIEDPPRLAKVLRRQWREGQHGVFDGFRIGVTQEPHKHQHFVMLLLALSRRSVSLLSEEPDAQVGEKRKAGGEDEAECGRDVLEDLSRAFRGWVEGREWLNMRLCLQFFSLLVPAGIVSASSLLQVYESLLSVLGEVGGGGDRAERVVRAVGEGLIRSGNVLYPLFPGEVEEMIGKIEVSVHARRSGKTLSNPFSPILPVGEEAETYHDMLDQLVLALQDLRNQTYKPPAALPRYWESSPLPEDMMQSTAYDLETVSMPPELYDVDEDRWQTGEGQISALRFFADDVVPNPGTALGWTLRGTVLDLVHVFEVNRKESARILLSLVRYFSPGTFKSSAPCPTDGDAEVPTSTLSIESLIISTILGAMFLLPISPCKSVYYGSVITELCKSSPNTVAPPVGRSVRRLFTMMGGEGLDIEIIRRTAEWFAIHLSNFGFQWMWKEWLADLVLPASHPKRAFMRRVVELEIRLAYYDRILDTLPEAMTVRDAGVLPVEPPEPVWLYEREEHPLHAEATELLKLFRTKVPIGDVKTHLETLQNATSGPDEPMASEIRLMAFETLLQLGSRSFSHFLNATERYLDVLRFLTPDPTARRILLDAVQNYWRFSPQQRLITIDKYIQYGVLEGLDVVDWAFSEDSGAAIGEEGDGWTDGDRWEVLKMCLDKHVGRVNAVRKRVRAVEREDEAARARRAAERLERGEGVGEEDVETEDARLDRSKEARDAQTSLDIQSSNLEKVLLATTKHFVASLAPWVLDPISPSQGLKAVLTLLDSGEEDWWGVRARWGWYKEFVRAYRLHLTPLAESVEGHVFAGMPKRAGGDSKGVEARAEGMVRSIWVAAVGGEE